jgi:hypothetical protein
MWAFGKRRKRRRSRKKARKVLSPSRRETPWATLTIRAEHYAMLRELSEFNDCTIGMAAMVLIETEFLRVLALSDPEKARKIEDEIREMYERGH